MMATAIHCLTFPCKPRNPSLTTNPSLSSKLKLATFRPLSFSSNLLSQNLFSKGCLSMKAVERRNRQSVICMARRYGANTRKREIQRRRKGGDREKKKKRRRKAARKTNHSFKIIRLVSSVQGGTLKKKKCGYVYVKRKGKNSEKLEIKKYDPRVKHHVLFKESK